MSETVDSLHNWVNLPSSLMFQDTKNADGPYVKNGQKIYLNFRMALSMEDLLKKKLLDEHEDDLSDREPIVITVGAGDVLEGVDEALVGMKVGSSRRLIIPPHLGFGERGIPGIIPKNATLYVEITVTTKSMMLAL